MSQNYQRWVAKLWYASEDTSSANYNSYGETDILPDTAAQQEIYISTVNYQYTPTHEIATDISGRPYSRNRGFVDGWTLTTTPYYFDSTGTKYQRLTLMNNVMYALTFRHLWISFSGQNLNAITTGITRSSGAAKVKVVFNSFAETINNASSSRTATISFRRKYRFD